MPVILFFSGWRQSRLMPVNVFFRVGGKAALDPRARLLFGWRQSRLIPARPLLFGLAAKPPWTRGPSSLEGIQVPSREVSLLSSDQSPLSASLYSNSIDVSSKVTCLSHPSIHHIKGMTDRQNDVGFFFSSWKNEKGQKRNLFQIAPPSSKGHVSLKSLQTFIECN